MNTITQAVPEKTAPRLSESKDAQSRMDPGSPVHALHAAQIESVCLVSDALAAKARAEAAKYPESSDERLVLVGEAEAHERFAFDLESTLEDYHKSLAFRARNIREWGL